MVADYPGIAEYFFQARVVADTTGLQPTMINGIPVFMITEDRIIPADTEKPENEVLLQELITEKLTSCHSYALALDLDSLKSEVEKLISFGAESGELFFYQLLLLLHDRKDTTEAFNRCGDEYKNEAEWLTMSFS